MAESGRKSSNFYGCTVVIILCVMASCGLPTRDDYTPPPEIIGGSIGSSVRVRISSGSAGFVLYYKLVSSDSSDDEFTGSGQGELMFKGRGYFKSSLDSVGSNEGSLWVPDTTTLFPIEVLFEYASDTSPFIKTTVRDANGVEDTMDIKRVEGSAFNAIKANDSDAGVFTGGKVDISLAMMNFNFNVNTFTRNPSVATFIGRMPNITLQ